MVSDSSNGIEKLDLDIYVSWSVQMKFLLIHKGLWEATVNVLGQSPFGHLGAKMSKR
jgi:hypothetical protein